MRSDLNLWPHLLYRRLKGLTFHQCHIQKLIYLTSFGICPRNLIVTFLNHLTHSQLNLFKCAQVALQISFLLKLDQLSLLTDFHSNCFLLNLLFSYVFISFDHNLQSISNCHYFSLCIKLSLFLIMY